MKVRPTINTCIKRINRCHVFLAVIVLAQCIAVYHIAFMQWQGPGDFGGNRNYLPAVMIALGKGFRDVAWETVQETPCLNSFIAFESGHLDPESLPENISTIEANEGHGIYLYMLYTVGYLWRIFGISWNVVRVLCVLLLLVYALLVYFISRLLLPPLWSLLVAHAFVWNYAVLSTMDGLRDFSKALFILSTVYVLGTMIKRTPNKRHYLWGAAVIGLVLGIGMGFRRDMQAILPLALIVMATVPLQPMRKRFFWRCSGFLVAVVVFLSFSFPILIEFYPQRWLNAHDTIMGFATSSDKNVELIAPGSYEKHQLQSDVYTTFKVWTDFQYGIAMESAQNAATSLPSPLTDTLRQRYIMRSVLLFPADFLTRAYAAVLRSCVGAQWTLVSPFQILESLGFITVIVGLIFIAASYPYKAWQILLMLCLFSGITSIQYGGRHAFHTAFLPPLFGLFVLYHLVAVLRNRHSSIQRAVLGKTCRYTVRIAMWVLVTFLAFFVPLKVAQHIQKKQIIALRETYQHAKSISIEHVMTPDWEGGTLISPRITSVCQECIPPTFYNSANVSVYVAHFDASAGPLEIDLIYDWITSDNDFSGPVLSYTKTGIETGRIAFYFPVYEIVRGDNWNIFSGIRVPNNLAGHFLGFEKIANVSELGYFLNLVVPENDEAFASMQRLILPWPHFSWGHNAYRDKEYHLYKIVEGIELPLSDGDTGEAIRLSKEALAAYPGRLQFRFLLAEAYFEEGNDETAWEVVDALLQAYSERSQVYRRLDILFARMEGIEHRYQKWRRIMETHPESPCARFYFEKSLATAVESALAAADTGQYQRLISEHPEFEKGVLQGDAWFMENSSLSKYKDLWRQITIEKPKSVLPYVRLGMAHERMGEDREAAEAYGTACANAPEHVEAKIRQATNAPKGVAADIVIGLLDDLCLLHPEKRSLALERLERMGTLSALEEDYFSAALYYQRAAHYADELQQDKQGLALKFRYPEMMDKHGDRGKAIDSLKRLLILYPDFYSGITLAEGMIDTETKVAFWREIALEVPTVARPWERMGDALAVTGCYKDAARAYTIAISNDPGDPMTVIGYSTAPLIPLDSSSRIKMVMRVLDEYPELADVAARSFIRGAAYYEEQGDNRRAADIYLHAIHCVPNNPVLRLHAAETLMRVDAIDEACDIMMEMIHEDIAKTVEQEVQLRVNLFLLERESSAYSLEAYVKNKGQEAAVFALPRLVEGVQSRIAQQDFESAERIARMAVCIAPESQISWTTLAQVYEVQDNDNALLKLWGEAILVADSITDIAAMFYEQLSKTRGCEEVHSEWERILELRADTPLLFLYYAKSLEAAGLWKQAAEVYREGLDAFPDTPVLMLRLGSVLARLGEWDGAGELIEESVTANESFRIQAIDMLVAISNELEEGNRPHQSERLFRQLFRLAPQSTYYLLRWVDILDAQGNTDEAVAVLKEAVRNFVASDAEKVAKALDTFLDPGDREKFWETFLADGFSTEGDRISFSQLAEKKKLPLRHYAVALADSGRLAEAIDILEALQGQYPEDIHTMLNLGLLQCKAGESQQGIEKIKDALGKLPERASEISGMLEQIFEAALKEKRYDQGEVLAHYLFSLSPDNLYYRFRLGEILFLKEKYLPAMEQLEYVLRNAPESPRAAHILDEIYEKTVSPEERAKRWRQLTEIHSESSTLNRSSSTPPAFHPILH